MAQRQAALSSVSLGSLPQGHADTAADTRVGADDEIKTTEMIGDQEAKEIKEEANAKTPACLLPILSSARICKYFKHQILILILN